ncbi:hypothetical protein [Streptomyces roseochromogenus]|uniref:hypothetical protein n=1 Tax=Streptomyces roseochromogenus TaxID=285450 RepID=UPI000AF3512A|nr:hypothetical protein [Streptomyces roseochromogenus]
MTNVGISLGAVLAGWGVQVGTLTAYQLMVTGNAIAFAHRALHHLGRPGWHVAGAMFALAGLAAPPAVRRAQHHRHTQLAPAEKASTA